MKQIFTDYVSNYLSPFIAKYSAEHNLTNKALLIIDNAPGHPMSVVNYGENIQVAFFASQHNLHTPTHGPRCHLNIKSLLPPTGDEMYCRWTKHQRNCNSERIMDAIKHKNGNRKRWNSKG
jgi:hypothetical protein